MFTVFFWLAHFGFSAITFLVFTVLCLFYTAGKLERPDSGSLLRDSGLSWTDIVLIEVIGVLVTYFVWKGIPWS